MKNNATRYLAVLIEKEQLSMQRISEQLDIPMNKLFPGTRESLNAEEFLKLCQYLKIRPEDIPTGREMI